MQPSRREFLTASVATVVLAGGSSAETSRTGCVRLACGRRIAYTEHGNPAGTDVLIHHHGLPSSRREAEVLVPALEKYPTVRLIAFDRPGIGDSDAVRRPSFNGWARDLAACADALDISRFSLTGTSGGAPYVCAVALAHPKRIQCIALACPVAEHQRGRDNGAEAWFLHMCERTPHAAASLLALGARRVSKKPETILKLFKLTPDEKVILQDPANLALVTGFMTDSVKHGAAGAVLEGALLPGPWGLALCEIAVPTTLLHGTCDPIAPKWMSEYLGRTIPGAVVRLYPGEGHLSVPKNHAADVLAAATGRIEK